MYLLQDFDGLRFSGLYLTVNYLPILYDIADDGMSRVYNTIYINYQKFHIFLISEKTFDT